MEAIIFLQDHLFKLFALLVAAYFPVSAFLGVAIEKRAERASESTPSDSKRQSN